MLSIEEEIQLVDALSTWAKVTPDVPVLGFLQGEGLLTPQEVVQAVLKRTQDGEAVLELLEYGVRHEGIGAVTARLTHFKPRPEPAAIGR